MLLGKYHIVIFKEKSGSSRNLRLRGWFGVCAFLAVSGLIACNVWLWQHYQENSTLQQHIIDVEREVDDQALQLTSMASKVLALQDDLDRVRQFDSKLRVMMSMERDPTDVSNVGGTDEDTFSRSYLPMHRQELMVRKMNHFLKQLASDVRLEEVRQQDLIHVIRGNREFMAALPTIWPVEGFLSSRFGSRPSPFTGQRETHKGLDISAKRGTPVLVPGRATVSFAGVDGAYGNTVILQHGGGITTRYAHLQRFTVKEGQVIKRGDILGYVGSTGRSSGPHLHYEVLLGGVNINPMRYILN